MSILRVGRKLLGESAGAYCRYANVAKVMGDHRLEIDDLLRRLVQRHGDRLRT